MGHTSPRFAISNRPRESRCILWSYLLRLGSEGLLNLDGKTDSIHSLAKGLENAPSCNGWTFWHYQKGGEVVQIDAARQLHLLASED